ncbi:hypothetical protein AB0M43_38200 [Longispora sp. NPDC051575]|uniref:hypothetical protein n=1 Tax=Longispora sp. NPDC051575 TaxID=3154943 RepID=UPI0034292D27
MPDIPSTTQPTLDPPLPAPTPGASVSGVVGVSLLAVLIAVVCGVPAYAWAQLATDSCGVQCPMEDTIRTQFGVAGSVLGSMLVGVLLGAIAPRRWEWVRGVQLCAAVIAVCAAVWPVAWTLLGGPQS